MREVLCRNARSNCVLLILFCALAGPVAGQAVDEPDSTAVSDSSAVDGLRAPADLPARDSLATADSSAMGRQAPALSDSLPAIERARLYLQRREFEAAYEAAEEAAVEEGLMPSSTSVALPDSFDAQTVPSILLYRGLSQELQRHFPEAAADYRVFLHLEPTSPRSRELRKRLPYVQSQSVRTLARRFRDEGSVPPPGDFADGARYAVGVFPLYNESSLLAMSQLAFGLTGVLQNALSLLDTFSDRPLPSVPYAHIRWVLDEILPQEIYAEPDTIPSSELARILDSDYLVLGKLNEVVGSLTANLILGRAVADEGLALKEVQSSYSQTGLQNLQLELTMALADSIQTMSGFTYTPSREAYSDSVRYYLINDVDQFIDYGYAMEQLLIGDPTEGRVLLLDSNLPVAQRDVANVAAIFEGDTPPADNLFELTGTAEELAAAEQVALEDSLAAAAAAQAAADSIRAATTVTTQVTRPVARSRRTAREVLVVSSTADQVLGPAAISMPRFDAFRPSVFPVEVDPRAGKSGTLDPTRQRAGVPVRVEIPVPRDIAPSNTPKK